MWVAGHLVRWSPGPLVLWSAGPLVLWSAGPHPLVRWSAGPATKSALQGPQSPAPATNSTLPHQKLLRLLRNLRSKATKSGTCHEICTSRSIKSCACHEICTLRPTKSCACHEICISRSTKKSCACHEICTPRPIKSCFKVHKVLRLPRNLHSKAHKVLRPPLATNSALQHVHCKVHKVLHLTRSTTTSKQASTSWRCAPPNPPRATKSALHPRHPRLPRNQYFKVNSPVPNFSNQANMPPLSLYLSIYLPIYVFIDPFIFLSFYLSICSSTSTKYYTCHEICTSALQLPQRPIKSCAYHWPPTLHFNIHKVLHLPRNVHCKVHKVLHLPRNTTTSKQASTSCSPLDLVCCWGGPPRHEICTKSTF